MYALRVTRGEAGVHLASVPTPEPGPGEVLLDVLACGICATDVEAAFNATSGLVMADSVTLGHEPAGRVVSVGEGVEDWAAGDRAAISCIVACGFCRMCVRGAGELCERGQIVGLHRDGALAEMVAVPQTNLVRLPDSVSDEAAALLTDAVATPYHALTSRGGLRAGESVVVFGAGGLGQHAILLARTLGAGLVIAVDLEDEQLAHAETLGVDAALRADDENLSKKIRGLTDGRGADLAGVFVGAAPAVTAAFRSVGRSGRVVVVGLTDNEVTLPSTTALARREISVLGSGGYTMGELQELVALVSAGRLDLSRSVSHEFPLADATEALGVLRDRVGSPRRIVVKP